VHLRRRILRIGAAVGLAIAATIGPLTSVAEAVAPGCDAAHPTFVGGPIYGYPDNYSLNAQVSLDFFDNVTGQKINPDGQPVSGYSWVQYINPTFPPTGDPNQGGTRTWGRCITGRTDEIFVEIYPKRPGNITDNTRYGGASHYRQPAISGGNYNNILLRLPVHYQADSVHGNTGSVNGYITFNNHEVPVAHITRVRAFSQGSGPECGVEGFGPSATALAPSQTYDATYYRIDYLAAGRCGADSQRYSLRITCSQAYCGGTDPNGRTLQRYINISKGTRIRVDIAF
jgi:hypothetical protein